MADMTEVKTPANSAKAAAAAATQRSVDTDSADKARMAEKYGKALDSVVQPANPKFYGR